MTAIPHAFAAAFRKNSPGGNRLQPSTELRFGILIDLDRAFCDRLAVAAERYVIKQQ